MPDNKRQHYLPASYLAHFSSDPTRGRKARLTRLGNDGRFIEEITAESQCAKGYFYSDDTEAEKEEWRELEGAWGRLVAQTTSADPPGNLAAILFEQLTTLHLRNISFDHTDENEDRLQSLKRTRSELWKIICGQSDSDGTFTLPPTWKAQIVSLDRDAFITSDNPVVMFANKPSQKYSCFGAPITPKQWVFVFDAAKWTDFVSGSVGDRPDLVWSLLNQVQAVASVQSLYCPSPFVDSEKNKYVSMFEHRQPAKFFGQQSAQFVMFNFPAHPMFPRPKLPPGRAPEPKKDIAARRQKRKNQRHARRAERRR